MQKLIDMYLTSMADDPPITILSTIGIGLLLAYAAREIMDVLIGNR